MSSPVRETGDKEMPKRQALSLRSPQALGGRACQETHSAQRPRGHERLSWGADTQESWGAEEETPGKGSGRGRTAEEGGHAVFFKSYKVQRGCAGEGMGDGTRCGPCLQGPAL